MSSLRISIPGIQEYRVDCTGYSLGLTSNIQSVTLRYAKVHLPVKVSQQAMRFSVVFRSQASFQVFQAAVRKYHLNVTNGAVKPCRIMYVSPKIRDIRGRLVANPSNPNISVLGYPLDIDGGASKFDFQPQVAIQFLLVRDLVSNTTSKFSNSTDPDNLVPDEQLIKPGDETELPIQPGTGNVPPGS